eukprot:COSAG04_NODE_8100_length_1023_cov_2.346320_2_plen_73_part_01
MLLQPQGGDEDPEAEEGDGSAEPETAAGLLQAHERDLKRVERGGRGLGEAGGVAHSAAVLQQSAARLNNAFAK